MGLCGGFATIGNIGFEGRMDYAAIGNVTNLAHRLCSIAQGDEILVNQRTLAKVERLIEAELKGEFRLKGIKRPINVYNVLGER
jgi:class 3 adenylate cyclase